MEPATIVLLQAAHNGQLQLLKNSAASLDRLLGGGGIHAILENTKDEHGRCAIHYAATGGRMNVLKYLVEEMGLDIDVQDGFGKTPLSRASIEGHLAAVEYLLAMGANPEILDGSDTSPLHYVAMKGRKDFIPLLLSKGGNVDVINGFGSPLQYAATAGEHDTVKVLLDHGANPNLVFQDVLTPLLASITSQSWECTEHLLKAGADPNGGPDGIIALPFAAELGATQIIKLLVEAGAGPDFTNCRGLKPVEAAAVNGNRQNVEILFPVTSPIPSYDDWSVNGVMKHVKSKKFEQEMIHKARENFLRAKTRGRDAFHNKEYCLAAYWYTEALNMKPGDATVLSIRSLCYVHLNKVDLAFKDASQCMLARPDWPQAFYRAGVALKLLNRLDDAADAFSKGLKLDPDDEELEDAFWEVSSARRP